MGSGSAVFGGIRDQAVPHLWDQGQKLVTLLESRNRNLGTKMGSALKKHTSLPPWRYVRRVYMCHWSSARYCSFVVFLLDVFSFCLVGCVAIRKHEVTSTRKLRQVCTSLSFFFPKTLIKVHLTSKYFLR